MKKAFLTLLLIVIFSTLNLFSQNWLENFNQDKKFSYKQLAKTFNNYWQGKEPYKGSGFKQYKRMEWLVKPRFWASDTIPDIAAAYKEWMNYSRKKENVDRMLDEPKWEPLGPDKKPLAGNSYSKPGVGRISCVEFDPSNSQIIYAGSATGGIWKSTDGGAHWIDLPMSDIMSIGISDIVVAPTNNNVIYAGTGDADAAGFLGVNFSFSVGVLKSTDAGNTWEPTNLAYQISDNALVNKLLVNPNDENIVFAGTNKGMYKTTDGGTNWNRVNTGFCRDMKFQPGNPNIIYCVFRQSHKDFSIDKYIVQTNTFQRQLEQTNVGRIILATNAKKPNTLYALMCTSYPYYAFHSIWRTTDGTTWTKRADKSNSPNYLAYLANGQGVEGQGLYDLSLATNPDNENEVYLGGVNIFKSTDGGATFDAIAEWTGTYSLPWVHADIHMLKFDGDDNLFACTDGGINKSTDNGDSWTDLSDGLSITQFYSISSSVQNENLISGGAQDNGSHIYNGSFWKNVYGGDGMNTIIDYSNQDIIYVSLYYGRILKSTNRGLTFKQIISGDYTQEQGAWVTPYILHPTNPNTVYVGMQNVWKSTNGGGNWAKISNFPLTNPPKKIQSIAISSSNPNTIYVSIENKVYKTIMGGGNWTEVGSFQEYVTSLLVDPKSPNRLWATLSGYTTGSKVYYYDGQKWNNISTGLPNIPVNCITIQKNTQNRLYCGTDVGVFTRDDANRDWVMFNNGLPNVIINALEIHEGTGKLRAGTYGRGVWEVPVVNCNLSPPEIEVSGDTKFCEGDSLQLTCKGNYSSYLWSTGSTSKSIWVKESGSWTVTVTDANNCSATSEAVRTTVWKTPAYVIKNLGNNPLCPGDTTELIASTFYYKYYHWSNGDSTKRIKVYKPGTYWVECVTKDGCARRSDNEITITMLPPAEKPVISEQGNKLISTEAKTYQWYLNGEKLAGETKRELVPPAPGTYEVEITNDDGCRAMSDPYELATSVDERFDKSIRIVPNPSAGVFRVKFYGDSFETNHLTLIVTNLTGQVIMKRTIKELNNNEFRVDLSGEPDGIYFVNINSLTNSSIFKVVKNTQQGN